MSAGSRPSRGRRVPRALHPLAWWIWAVGLAVAVERTTNPLLILLALGVLALVVAHRRTDAPWARAFKYYLWLGVSVIALRVIFRAVFGAAPTPGEHVLLTLPHLPTPHWYSGVTIGGPVSLEAVLSAATDGLRLATILCCVGAANVLANPKRALRLLPGALYELGMAVVVAVSVAPQLVESVQRVARARRLRGGGRRGVRALRSIAIPVLEDALDRALHLAAAMDSRGYGRTGGATRASRALTSTLLLAGMIGLCAGAYGVLDATAPGWLGLPTVLGGAALACGGLACGGRRVTRTRYRPDPWRWPEWAVAGCGVASAVLLVACSGAEAASVTPSFYPLRFPPLPVLPAVAILLSALAAVAAPPPTQRPRVTPAPEPSRPAPRAVDAADLGRRANRRHGVSASPAGGGR